MLYGSGTLPTLEDLESFRNELVDKPKDELMLIKKTSAEDILRKTQVLPNNQIKGSLSNTYKQENRKKRGNSVFVTQGSSVGGGTGDVLNALAAYLRYLEGTMRDDWQEYVFPYKLKSLFFFVNSFNSVTYYMKFKGITSSA